MKPKINKNLNENSKKEDSDTIDLSISSENGDFSVVNSESEAK